MIGRRLCQRVRGRCIHLDCYLYHGEVELLLFQCNPDPLCERAEPVRCTLVWMFKSGSLPAPRKDHRRSDTSTACQSTSAQRCMIVRSLEGAHHNSIGIGRCTSQSKLTAACMMRLYTAFQNTASLPDYRNASAEQQQPLTMPCRRLSRAQSLVRHPFQANNSSLQSWKEVKGAGGIRMPQDFTYNI